MTAIKTWFLEKNGCRGFYGKPIKIIKETEKAVLVRVIITGTLYDEWVPKSCIIDEWEKDTSNYGYHDYLVNTLTVAYKDGRIENGTFKSGRNIYDKTSFLHQEKTKDLIRILEKYGIEFLNRAEWNNR